MKNARRCRLDANSNIGKEVKEDHELAEDERECQLEPWKIVGKSGCSAAVKALHVGFKNIPQVFRDPYFVGRLMHLVSEIFKRCKEESGGNRSILFSRCRSLLATMRFNKKRLVVDWISYELVIKHSEMRREVTVSAKDLNISKYVVSNGVTHYRILSHLSIISDYAYIAKKQRYEPISMYNTMSAFAYSDYLPVWEKSSFEIVVSFPEGGVPSEDDSVIHCLGIELYGCSGLNRYYFYSTGSGIRVEDIF